MASAVIKFFTGTTSQLAQLTQNLSTYIALNTQTGACWWNYNGTKYYLNYISDWDVSDSSSPAFIKNKPHILTMEDLIGVLDVSQLADATKMITSYSAHIDPAEVSTGSGGKYFYSLGKRMPNALVTNNGTMYSIEPSTISKDANLNITLQLSNYMAYENVTTVPNTWSLWYA